MNIESVLLQMHATHNQLMKEKDINGSHDLRGAIQRHAEAIMWLDKHVMWIEENTFYNSHPSGVGPDSVE